jgi:hypothetical protein
MLERLVVSCQQLPGPFDKRGVYFQVYFQIVNSLVPTVGGPAESFQALVSNSESKAG